MNLKCAPSFPLCPIIEHKIAISFLLLAVNTKRYSMYIKQALDVAYRFDGEKKNTKKKITAFIDEN